MAYTISKSSWHFRLYKFHQENLCRHYHPVRKQVCLCPYMRGLLVWLPLKAALLIACIGAILWLVGIVVWALIQESTVAGWLVVGECIGVIVLVVGLIVGACLAFYYLKDKAEEWRHSVANYEPKTLAGQWAKSFHEKICPCFEITE